MRFFRWLAQVFSSFFCWVGDLLAQASNEEPVDERLEVARRINSLDFSRARASLWHTAFCDKDEQRLKKADIGYRQFLFLKRLHPRDRIAPWNADIQEFWRLHARLGRKYDDDMTFVFGLLVGFDPKLVVPHYRSRTDSISLETWAAYQREIVKDNSLVEQFPWLSMHDALMTSETLYFGDEAARGNLRLQC